MGHGIRSRHAAQVAGTSGGGWRVRATSRWTSFRAGRGGGEWVQEKGSTTSNATNGGAVGQRGKEEIQKIGGDRWGGRVRITCVIIGGA